MKVIKIIALVLLVVGGLNWGLVGVANFDLVATIFGDGSVLSRIVYSLVGVSAIVVGILHFGCCKKFCCSEGACETETKK